VGNPSAIGPTLNGLMCDAPRTPSMCVCVVVVVVCGCVKHFTTFCNAHHTEHFEFIFDAPLLSQGTSGASKLATPQLWMEKKRLPH